MAGTAPPAIIYAALAKRAHVDIFPLVTDSNETVDELEQAKTRLRKF